MLLPSLKIAAWLLESVSVIHLCSGCFLMWWFCLFFNNKVNYEIWLQSHFREENHMWELQVALVYNNIKLALRVFLSPFIGIFLVFQPILSDYFSTSLPWGWKLVQFLADLLTSALSFVFKSFQMNGLYLTKALHLSLIFMSCNNHIYFLSWLFLLHVHLSVITAVKKKGGGRENALVSDVTIILSLLLCYLIQQITLRWCLETHCSYITLCSCLRVFCVCFCHPALRI